MSPSELAVEFVRTTPLNQLGEVFKVLAERLYVERRANNGFIPREIFERCVGMSGMSVSVQIVNELIDDKAQHLGYALKQRDSSELGDAWAGLYHSTCTTARMTDTPTSMLERNAKEAFGAPWINGLEFLGVTIHDEPERCSACLTVMYHRTVTLQEFAQFTGTWKTFSSYEDIRHHNKEIVDHNWYLLEWVCDRNRPIFADVRGGWWPRKDRGEPRPEQNQVEKDRVGQSPYFFYLSIPKNFLIVSMT